MSISGRAKLGCLQVPHPLIMPPVPPEELLPVEEAYISELSFCG